MNTKSINYFILVLTMLLFACKTKQIASESETIRFDEYNADTRIPASPEVLEIDTLMPEIAVLDSAALDAASAEIENKKSVYKIAVVFPFMEDSMRRAWIHSKDKNFQEFKISQETETSISFMEGMIMAIIIPSMNEIEVSVS
jgi:hypothetical protein